MRILHRYILGEMLKALLLALGAVTGVVCLGMVLQALQQKGIGPVTSVLFMALSLPGAAYLALPLAAVLAGTLVYGRFAADNEILACRASGIPVSSLLWPGVVLALVAGAASLALAAWPLPESTYSAKRIALADVERLFFTQLSGTGKVKIKEANFELTVDRVVGDMLYGPTLRYRTARGQTYCYAPFGRVEFDHQAKRAKLALWESVVVDEENALPVRGTHKVDLPLPTFVPREEDNLSLPMLLFMQRHPERSDRVQMLAKDAPEAAVAYAKKVVRARSMAEMHGRLAGALGCLGLVLIGVGLGLYFHSGHLLTAFGVALVPWLGATITTMIAVKAACAKQALDHPQDFVWLIWVPNLAAAALGGAVLSAMSWLWGRPVRLRHLLGRGPA